MNPIADQFSHIENRQMRYQARQRAKGKCESGCGRRIAKDSDHYCRTCLNKRQARYNGSKQ